MEKLIAYCGLDCGKCPAFIATQKDDKEGLAKTAAQWAEQFKVEVKPEDVVCDGCITPSPKKASYCNMCEIRSCCVEKELENCALCSEYACEKLTEFFEHAPEAEEGLKEQRKAKSV